MFRAAMKIFFDKPIKSCFRIESRAGGRFEHGNSLGLEKLDRVLYFQNFDVVVKSRLEGAEKDL